MQRQIKTPYTIRNHPLGNKKTVNQSALGVSQDSEEARIYKKLPRVTKPSHQELERLELSGMNLVRDNPHQGVVSKYYFNLLNLRAYKDNWECLDYEMQRTIRSMIDSDLIRNCLKHGMKQREQFYQNLLLLAGVEIWNILPFANTNMVISNLKTNYGRYSKYWTRNRALDSRSCRQAHYAFEKKYDLKKLFRNNNACILNFESDESYRHQPEASLRGRNLYQKFFSENANTLKKAMRSRLISSYLYSHEISCDSILRMHFRPHTHALVFFPKSPLIPDIRSKMKETDRTLQIMADVHTSYSTVKDFVRYLFGAYSIVSVYEREYRNDNVLELNKNTVQAMHLLLEMTMGDSGSRSVQRNNHSNIPLKPVN